MPSGDVYELNVDGTLAGQNICNVHHYVQVGTDGTGSAFAALSTLWNDVNKPVFLDCCSDEYDIVRYRVRRLKPIESQTQIFAATGAGTNVAISMPNQICSILRQHAVPLLRRGTGHVKIPAMPITGVEEGRVTVAQAALMQLYGVKMIANQAESGSGYVFRAGVFSQVDEILREIVKIVPMGQVKTVYSRGIGTGS